MIMFDCATAFACAKHSHLNASAKEWLKKDATYVGYMLKWSQWVTPTIQGDLAFHGTDGNMMGHRLAVQLFCHHYSWQIADWNMQHYTEEERRGFYGKEKQTSR